MVQFLLQLILSYVGTTASSVLVLPILIFVLLHAKWTVRSVSLEFVNSKQPADELRIYIFLKQIFLEQILILEEMITKNATLFLDDT